MYLAGFPRTTILRILSQFPGVFLNPSIDATSILPTVRTQEKPQQTRTFDISNLWHSLEISLIVDKVNSSSAHDRFFRRKFSPFLTKNSSFTNTRHLPHRPYPKFTDNRFLLGVCQSRNIKVLVISGECQRFENVQNISISTVHTHIFYSLSNVWHSPFFSHPPIPRFPSPGNATSWPLDSAHITIHLIKSSFRVPNRIRRFPSPLVFLTFLLRFSRRVVRLYPRRFSSTTSP